MGKKIEKREMQWVCLAVLAPIALILISSSLALMQPEVLSSLKNKGPHGLSTILYTYTSCSANNGSAFAGLNSNTLFYNLSTTLCMFLARLALLIPSLFIAGSLVQKKRAPFSLGILSTDTFLFLSLLLGSILIVGALSFFPALSLGPIVEHFLMLKGRGF